VVNEAILVSVNWKASAGNNVCKGDDSHMYVLSRPFQQVLCWLSITFQGFLLCLPGPHLANGNV